MNNKIDEAAQLDVEISNLYATTEEIDKLKKFIAFRYNGNTLPPVVRLVGSDKKGEKYEIFWRIIDPSSFRLEKIQEWLYEANLVGWKLNLTVVKNDCMLLP